jgi:hypothetical protein
VRLGDLKEGVVYAYQRSKHYDPVPMIWLGSTQLWHERDTTRREGPLFRCIENPSKYDKPKSGIWGHGSTGYAVAFMEARMGRTNVSPEGLAVLLTASLKEFSQLTRGFSPGQDWSDGGPDVQLTAKQEEETLRHHTIRYDVLVSLGQVKGEWDVVKAEADRMREAKEARWERERREKEAIDVRYADVSGTLNSFGIQVQHRNWSSDKLLVSLEQWEEIAGLVVWARSVGMKRVAQLGLIGTTHKASSTQGAGSTGRNQT